MAFSTPVDGFVPATGKEGSTAFYNAVRDTPIDPVVPALMNETSDLVREYLDLNQNFARDALATANKTIAALAIPVLPVDLPPPPTAPAITTTFAGAVSPQWEQTPDLGSITAIGTDPFVPTAIVIPSIEEEIPEYTSLGLMPVIPLPPTLVLPGEPTEPSIDYTFDLPTAPVDTSGGAPDLEEFVMPAFTRPAIPSFDDDAPTFDVLPPDPRLQWEEPVYASTIKDAVAAVLQEMLAGGTGLDTETQTALWEKGRVREDVSARKAVEEAEDGWTAKGFSTNGGPLNRIVLAAQEEAARRGNELSREVMLKVADMEQSNRQFAVTQSLSYEQIFTGVFLAVVGRNFEIAKFAVDTQIQVYNLQVTAFNVERQVFDSKIARFRVRLDAAFADLKVFEALIGAEKAKGEINLARVQVFGEKVKAYNAQVSAFEALVKAASAKADLQKNKVDVYKAQIEAMVAKIGAQRAKFDAYDAQIKGETSKIALEESNARVYGERIKALGLKADIILKEADVALGLNKQTLEWNIANMQRHTARNAQELDIIQARLAAFQAVTSRSTAKFNADLGTKQAELQSQVELSRIAIARYTALLEQWKTRSAEITAFAQIASESLRAAGTMASNLAAGAMAGTHVSAGLSASSGATQSTGRNTSSSSSQSQSTSESNSYGIVHQYNHRV